MKILICDDKEPQGAESHQAVLEGTRGINYADVRTCFDAELGEQLRGLDTRFRNAEASPAVIEAGDLVFDDVDVVLLDNNLTSLKEPGPFLTAEAVISYIRAFTSAKYIVSLNKNPTLDFDLQHLIGDRETRADVALNTRHLANRGLWTGEPDPEKEGFLPWYWPRLVDAGERRAEQIRTLIDQLDEPVLKALRFSADDVLLSYMSSHAKSLLSVPGKGDDNLISATFREVFVGTERIFADVEARKAYAEIDEFRPALARSLASAIDRWFRLDLIAPQEVLVDLPHLIQRMPFLLGDSAGDLDTWNRVTRAAVAPFGIDQDEGGERVIQALFDSPWAEKPLFVWPYLKNDQVLDEIFYRSEEEWAETVFCEDVSRFEPIESGPQSFVADVAGSWRRRYVRKLAGYSYRPEAYLAA